LAAAAIPFFLDDAGFGDGVALCLSGGGYRAMLYHAGAIWRLNELGLLRRLSLVSSVSGGAIAAGALAVGWNRLAFDEKSGSANNLREAFLAPILRQAEDAIDYESIAIGFLPWNSAFRKVAESYAGNITGADRTLNDLPAAPGFVFCATSLMSGRNWQFARDGIGDWRVGWAAAPDIPLAQAMAASSAFPPFLSPAGFEFTDLAFMPPPGGHPMPDLGKPPFTAKARLTDGGVYDNMGLEPAWKRYRTLLVSNAGHPFEPHEDPATDWLGQARRILDIAMEQDQDLRERILVYTYRAGLRNGALWGLNVRASGVPDAPPPLLTADELAQARGMRTRLNAFSRAEQALMLKVGYAQADYGLRRWYAKDGGFAADPGRTPPAP
jgi:NTE family protein